MKEIWTRDVSEILDELDQVVAGTLSIQNRQGKMTQTRVIKLHEHNGNFYLLIKRPSEINVVNDIKTAYYKLNGKPILGFPCIPEKISEKYLAISLPEEIFQVQLRKFPRYLTPKGAMISFLIKDKRRVTICELQDISLSGARLFGIPRYDLMEKDIIGPATLTLSGFHSVVVREITLQDAIIQRIIPRKTGESELGVSFELSSKDKKTLAEHIMAFAM